MGERIRVSSLMTCEGTVDQQCERRCRRPGSRVEAEDMEAIDASEQNERDRDFARQRTTEDWQKGEMDKGA